MKTKMWILLSIMVLAVACGDSNSCQQCGFNANEQVVNTTTNKIYYADSNGCVRIPGSCGNVKIKTLNT